MTREEELTLIKKERAEMEKHMTDMFDLEFMLNNHRNDIMSPQAHYEKLSRMVTHYMCSIQQSYGYMSDKTIEALEQEPCEDCISREEVMEYIKNCTINLGYENGTNMVLDVISNMPSVQPIRPKGEWNFTKEGRFFCPYCKKFPKDQSCTTDFCPNCGAKMTESEEV